MIELISYFSGNKDEKANIVLAIQLSETEDSEGIKEIVQGLNEKNIGICNDCIKVIYEIGSRKPNLIAEYVMDFLNFLESKNNRMVWGAMMSLSAVSFIKYNEISDNFDKVYKAYKEGSVITIDNSISVFAELVKSDVKNAAQIYDILLDHLSTCRPKEVAQHSERAFVCINEKRAESFKKVLLCRLNMLSEPQGKRVMKLIDKIDRNKFC